MLISVLGTGYLGATHAACLAACGHDVVGVDVDPLRLARLCQGHAPFHEPGLDELLSTGVADGRLRFTDDLGDAAAADVHFLCVGTPQVDPTGRSDLTALWSVVDELGGLLRRPCLVVGKSTVPVGTAARVRDRLRAQAPVGAAVSVAWNPEFLREGHAVEDSLTPDRLVLGVEDDEDEQRLREVYGDLLERGVPAIRTDLATAELAKVSANALLAARISVVNLLAEVCEQCGADIGDLTEVLGSDPRIGRAFLRPGLGYGGGCLPKDTRGFVARARELGVEGPTALLDAVDAVNLHQRRRTAALALALLPGPVEESEVAVLGGAFKAGSDDVRDSPALDVVGQLLREGVRMRLHDPRAAANVRRRVPEVEVVDDVASACRRADLVLVLTDWPEFAALDPVALAAVVRRRTVLDARLAIEPGRWAAAGWDVHALGRPRAAPTRSGAERRRSSA